MVQILFLFPGVAYKLSSDDRVFTDQDDLTSDSIITNEITLQQGNRTCQTHEVYLKVPMQPCVCSQFVSLLDLKVFLLNCGILLDEVVS